MAPTQVTTFKAVELECSPSPLPSPPGRGRPLGAVLAIWSVANCSTRCALPEIGPEFCLSWGRASLVSKASAALSGVAAINGYTLATRNTPAATIVAAWISALTGVGPSIASGNQTCSGTWPDLPIAPQKIRSEIAVDTARPALVGCATRRANEDCSRQPCPSS